ncbi:acid phosphatase-related [Holotrichia oblita]|uniref:Acid phosphatase-related n=1 Tax=Holotrichia oblita TaxID=644536 RepID=A0ACB9SWT5_HOLOL|nr:acid phosphatase-related [Holotrichia oblita]
MAPLRVLILTLVCCVLQGDFVLSRSSKCTKHTLSLLHVIFRHGNKTLEATYPTNPYKHIRYDPFGEGQLTNGGKLLGYRTGQYLRKKYNDFLGSYTPEVLGAYSSQTWRCKAYLQLIMASLFPPGETEKWDKDFFWQAHPVNGDCALSQKLFWSYVTCPNFAKSYRIYKESPAYAKIMSPYNDTITYLRDESGLWQNNTFVFGTPIYLHAAFTSQVEWGLELPAWAKSVWPETLSEIAALEWAQLFATEEGRTLGAGNIDEIKLNSEPKQFYISGHIISKIFKDTKLHINKDPSVNGKKIYLYVGHDTNMYGTLAWLGVLKPEMINFGAYVIFEIHSIHDEYYVKVLYQNKNVDSKLVTLQLPECGGCCPLNKFATLYASRLNPETVCG